MSEPRWWPAPAKLNLMLRIIRRRADGYHDLQTLFQFTDLADELLIGPRPDGQIVISGQSAVVSPASDLIRRAAQALCGVAGKDLGADIRVRKRIPIGGGLGGGSSDAATTLIALNRLWHLGLDRDALAELGLGLGADVPVFILGRAAYAEGVGEVLTPLILPEFWYLIIDPGCAVSTAKVFSAPSLTRNNPAIKIPEALMRVGENHCLPVVRDLYPAVGAAFDWLAQRADACLSGTGGCVFAAFESAVQARRIMTELPDSWSGFVVRGVNRHPLADE